MWAQMFKVFSFRLDTFMQLIMLVIHCCVDNILIKRCHSSISRFFQMIDVAG